MKKIILTFGLTMFFTGSFCQSFDYRKESQNAINLLDEFWKIKFQKKNLTLRIPNRTFYSVGYPVKNACGETEELNAFYCPTDNSISLSKDLFSVLSKKYDNNGLIYFIIAHEYGHLVQSQLKDVSSLSIDRELQADCLAGVFFHHINQEGLVEKKDILTVKAFFYDFANEQGGWHLLTDSNAHGTPESRFNYFIQGLEKGSASGCMSNSIEKVSDDFINSIVEIFSKKN